VTVVQRGVADSDPAPAVLLTAEVTRELRPPGHLLTNFSLGLIRCWGPKRRQKQRHSRTYIHFGSDLL